jgi:uncharacterized protein YndB with AHSA1/START domain
MTRAADPFDPERDLALERTLPLPPERVWRAWTDPEELKQWFTPRPWRTVEAVLELRPGGLFRTVMESPEGERFPNDGCVLEVDEGRRLVFTDAMGPGYRPAEEPFMTEGEGTRFAMRVLHASPEARRKHEEMGFERGWGTALDQLVELVGTDGDHGG